MAKEPGKGNKFLFHMNSVTLPVNHEVSKKKKEKTSLHHLVAVVLWRLGKQVLQLNLYVFCVVCRLPHATRLSGACLRVARLRPGRRVRTRRYRDPDLDVGFRTPRVSTTVPGSGAKD